MDQVNKGICSQGTLRNSDTVTIKFIALNIDEIPFKCKLKIKKSTLESPVKDNGG